MQGYTPLFNEIVDSSLWKEPLHVRVVFLTLMAMKDFDHVVRLEIHKIANKANVGDELFLDAMKVLAEPDRNTTIPQPFDGRRIEKVEEGWKVLNGAYYQKLMQDVNKRARWARLKREQREKSKSGKPLGGSNILNEPGEQTGLRMEQMRESGPAESE